MVAPRRGKNVPPRESFVSFSRAMRLVKIAHSHSGCFATLSARCALQPATGKVPGVDVQRGAFALVGLFKFHSVSLCGRLYPLPRRTTFRFRNALHLIEARNRVAYVRGIFQRLLALLRERELGCGYPITSWLGQLCHYFFSLGSSLRTGGPGIVLMFDCGSFSSSCRVVWVTSFPRVDSAMRGPSISFLTRASVAWLDSCFGSFLCIVHDVTSAKGLQVNLEQGWQFQHCFQLSSLEQSLPICKM